MLVCGLLDVLVPVLGLAALVLPLPAFDALLPDELPEPLAAVLLWLPDADALPCVVGCEVVLSASALSVSRDLRRVLPLLVLCLIRIVRLCGGLGGLIFVRRVLCRGGIAAAGGQAAA